MAVQQDGHPGWHGVLPLRQELDALIKDVANDSTAKFAFTEMKDVP